MVLYNIPKIWLVIVPIAIVLTLNFTGFCYSKFRYLSDEEFLVSAVLYASTSRKIANIANTREQALKYINDNPNCCEVGGNNHMINTPFLNAIFFRRLTIATVKLPTSEEETRGEMYEYLIFYDCCGRYVEETGIPYE